MLAAGHAGDLPPAHPRDRQLPTTVAASFAAASESTSVAAAIAAAIAATAQSTAVAASDASTLTPAQPTTQPTTAESAAHGSDASFPSAAALRDHAADWQRTRAIGQPL